MFTIKINDISEEGVQLDHQASSSPWLREAIETAFGRRRHPTDEARVTLILARHEEQITMIGGAYVHTHPMCDRCLKVYNADEQIPIHIIYVPSGVVQEVKGEDDVDCSFYSGREIDVQAAVTEQLVLAQPMQYLCTPNCRGLCPHCGLDLNAGLCRCPQPAPTSPFSVLNVLATPKKRAPRSS